MKSRGLAQLFFIFFTIFNADYFAKAQTIDSKKPKKKIAVVMNMGSADDQGAFIRQNTAEAKALYEKQGYEVIVLSNEIDSDPSKWATKKNLENVLSRQSGLSEIKIDLYGHGKLKYAADVPAGMEDRYPQVPLADSAKNAGDPVIDFSQKTTFMAVSITPEVALINKKEQDPVKKAANDKLTFDASLGVGDLSKIIKTVQANNPDVKTQLLSLNCFSGCLGQELSKLNNVSIFNASETTKLATEFEKAPESTDPKRPTGFPDPKESLVKSQNYPLLLNRFIAEGMESGRPISMNEAHRKTVDSMIESLLMNHRESYNFPQSAVQNSLFGWCSRNPEVSLISKCAPSTFKGVSDLSDMMVLQNIQNVDHVPKKITDLLNRKISENRCEDNSLQQDMKNDQASREKIKTDLAQEAFSKIEKNLDQIDQMDINAIRKKHEDNLKEDLETAKATYFCPDRTSSCEDAKKWQQEQKYINKIETQIRNIENYTLADLKKNIKSELAFLRSSGCVMKGPKPCDDRFGTKMGYLQFLGQSANLFEPLKVVGGTPDQMSGPPAGICSLPRAPPAAMDPKSPPRPLPKKTPEQVMADNQKVIQCMQNKIIQKPPGDIIRLAIEANSMGNMTFKEPQEACELLQNQRALYQKQMACSQRFLSEASLEEKQKFNQLVQDNDVKIEKSSK